MPFSKNDNFPVWLKYVVSPQFSTFDFQTKTIAIKKLFIKTSKKIPQASGNTIIYRIQIIFIFLQLLLCIMVGANRVGFGVK